MKFNPDVVDCAPAPIAEAWSWVEDRNHAELIDVCQAVPAYPPHRSLTESLSRSIAAGEGATYTDIAGIEPLRSALAEDINQRYRADARADDVMITAGCNQAFCSVIDALCAAGDNVIVPLPCYFNHEMWLTIRGVKINWLDFNPRTATPDPEQARPLIGDRTRAIVLVTPNNPTGAIYDEHTVAAFHALCHEYDIALILDETYRDFMDDSKPPHDLFSHPQWRRNLVHLYSFSKAFSLTGYRVGAVVTGPALRRQLTKVQDCVAISAPHVGQLAALHGLGNLKPWRREKGLEMIERAAAIRRAFESPGLDYRLVAAGAYFAYVEHPFQKPARDVAERLARNFRVVSLPGTYFGEGQQQFLRFAFANVARTRFSELIDRLKLSQQRH